MNDIYTTKGQRRGGPEAENCCRNKWFLLIVESITTHCPICPLYPFLSYTTIYLML